MLTTFNNALNLAEQQLNEVQERIKVGKLPEAELIAAQSQVTLTLKL